MLGKYHPGNLPACQFTGRISKSLVRSTLDGRYYDDVVLDEKRQRIPASLEVINPSANSVIIPEKRIFQRRRHLAEVSENLKNMILSWVVVESKILTKWILDKGYHDLSIITCNDSAKINSKFSEIIVREPEQLVLLRLLCFNFLLKVCDNQNKLYSSDLEFCFKLLAVGVVQNRSKKNTNSFAVDNNTFLSLQSSNSMLHLNQLNSLQTSKILSYLSHKDVTSYFSTHKPNNLDISGSKDVKAGAFISKLKCSYDLSLYNYYLNKDDAIKNMPFLEKGISGSGRKVYFCDLFSSLKSEHISNYSSQRDIIMDYRREKIQDRDVVRQQSMALKRDRAQFEAEKAELERRERACEQVEAEKAELERRERACEQEKNRLQMLELRLKSMQKMMSVQNFIPIVPVVSLPGAPVVMTEEFFLQKEASIYKSGAYLHEFYTGFIDKDKINKNKMLEQMRLGWSKKSQNEQKADNNKGPKAWL